MSDYMQCRKRIYLCIYGSNVYVGPVIMIKQQYLSYRCKPSDLKQLQFRWVCRMENRMVKVGHGVSKIIDKEVDPLVNINWLPLPDGFA